MRQLLIFFAMVFFLPACSPDTEEVNVRLTMEEREQLDEMVTEHMDSLRPLLEANCEGSFDDLVAVTTDSIVQRRLEEEARLRARIPQNLSNGR
ncbi:MAG: hypothetical protein AAGA31_03230 [Bacteroidota bacterium]